MKRADYSNNLYCIPIISRIAQRIAIGSAAFLILMSVIFLYPDNAIAHPQSQYAQSKITPPRPVYITTVPKASSSSNKFAGFRSAQFHPTQQTPISSSIKYPQSQYAQSKITPPRPVYVNTVPKASSSSNKYAGFRSAQLYPTQQTPVGSNTQQPASWADFRRYDNTTTQESSQQKDDPSASAGASWDFLAPQGSLGSQLKADLNYMFYGNSDFVSIVSRGVAGLDLFTLGGTSNYIRVNVQGNAQGKAMLDSERLKAAARLGVTAVSVPGIGAVGLAYALPAAGIGTAPALSTWVLPTALPVAQAAASSASWAATDFVLRTAPTATGRAIAAIIAKPVVQSTINNPIVQKVWGVVTKFAEKPGVQKAGQHLIAITGAYGQAQSMAQAGLTSLDQYAAVVGSAPALALIMQNANIGYVLKTADGKTIPRNKYAVIIFADKSADWNGALNSDRILDFREQLEGRGYTVRNTRVDTVEGLIERMGSFSAEQAPDLLVIGAHGTQKGMTLGNGTDGYLNIGGVRRLAAVKDGLADEGTIVLFSCSTGKGEAAEMNMANAFAEIFPQARHVLAPKVPAAARIVFGDNNEAVGIIYNNFTRGAVSEINMFTGETNLTERGYDAVFGSGMKLPLNKDPGLSEIIQAGRLRLNKDSDISKIIQAGRLRLK